MGVSPSAASVEKEERNGRRLVGAGSLALAIAHVADMEKGEKESFFTRGESV